MTYVTVVTRDTRGIGVPDLAERLRSLIEAKGLTPYALAKAAGVDTTYIYRILKGQGKRPSHATLTRLAGVLGVTVEDLIGETWAPPELPGTEGLPPAFASAIQNARHRLSPRQWEMAAGFLTWLASQAEGESSEPSDPPEAYGYGLPDGPQPTDIEQGKQSA